MKSLLKLSLAGVAAVGAIALTASACWAGCGDISGIAPASYQDDGAHSAVTPAAWRGDSDARLVKAGFDIEDHSIVGMWRVQFLVGGNAIDFALAQWHADGTEFMNSGTLNPAGQNYCLGVWQKAGAGYHLNHFAFAYVPQTQTPSGDPAIHINPAMTVNIKEDVVLDRSGNSYSGTFTIDAYDFKTNALIPAQHVAGRVVAQRVTAY